MDFGIEKLSTTQKAEIASIKKAFIIGGAYLGISAVMAQAGIAPVRDSLLAIVCVHFIWSICRSK